MLVIPEQERAFLNFVDAHKIALAGNFQVSVKISDDDWMDFDKLIVDKIWGLQFEDYCYDEFTDNQ